MRWSSRRCPVGKQQRVFHAIPHSVGWGSQPFPQVYDVTHLAYADQVRVKQELETQGYWVQEWFPMDPVEVLVRAEMRKRVEDEQASAQP